MSGRPLHTYGDPVARLTAWTWLFTFALLCGCKTVTELDAWCQRKLKIDRRRLLEIADDGADPRTKKAVHHPKDDTDPHIRAAADKPYKKTDSLNNKVWSTVESNMIASRIRLPIRATNREVISVLNEVLNHPVWEALRDISCATVRDKAAHEKTIEREFRAANVIALTREDIDHVVALGLRWEEFESVAGPYGECRPVGKLKNLASHSAFASLDGIYVLLMQLRKHRHYYKLAGQLEDTLLRAVLRFSLSFFEPQESNGHPGLPIHREYLDTWELVINTCATDKPHLLVTDDLNRKALLELESEFQREQAHVRKKRKYAPGGRPPKGPMTARSGKVGRRWQRKAYIRACCRALHPEQTVVGFARRSLCIQWLVSNREPIKDHFTRALIIQAVGPGTVNSFRNEGSDEYDEHLRGVLLKNQTLRVPCDRRHRFERPEVDYSVDIRLGDPWDYMHLIPTPPHELHLVAALPVPEGSAASARDDALADEMEKQKSEDFIPTD